MVNDFLFELGTEELPSGLVWPLADALANQMITRLGKADLKHGKVSRFASPRRIGLLIEDVQSLQNNQKVLRRGPVYSPLNENESPSQALLGFAKSCGVSIKELTHLKTEKGEWWAYEGVTAGVAAQELLPVLLKESLHELPVPKLMRWGNGEDEFARPVHWAVLLFGEEVLAGEFFGVKTSRYSFGHRFHHPERLEISTPKMYEALLRDAYVLADFDTRRQTIISQVNKLAQLQGFTAVMPEALVDEVTSIVEWPQPLLAGFEKEFLEVPTEALIASMQAHQKCFALKNKNGQLVPYFITVANIVSTNPAQVIAGNEKVMRARLSDAAFFYRQDKKNALSALKPATEKVIFQAKLGSLADKIARMHILIEPLVSALNLNRENALRAVELSKCDLMTGMVGEFPELQGLMGYYYALHDQENETVAIALNEQYMPRFSGDELPKTPTGLALSLVERMDTLVGIFAIGQKPTGVKDPFKLRRHALAVARMLMAVEAPLSLSTLIQNSLATYESTLSTISPECSQDLKFFILERLLSYYQSQNIPEFVVLAARAREDERLYDMDKRIQALITFLALPEAQALSAACKRVNNMLQQADSLQLSAEIQPHLLQESAEKSLLEQIIHLEQKTAPLYAAKDYVNILNVLAGLKIPIDTFFDQVLVMVEDPQIKQNRLKLLMRMRNLLQGVADISLLQLGHE